MDGMEGMLPFLRMLAASQGGGPQLPTGPKKIKCPVCNAEHPYKRSDSSSGSSSSSSDRNGSSGNRVSDDNRCSHNARVVFTSGSCPVCLDDNIEPPLVALACGHLVCRGDFKNLGGKMGKDSTLSADETARREREAARRQFEERRRNGEPMDIDDIPDGLAGMFPPGMMFPPGAMPEGMEDMDPGILNALRMMPGVPGGLGAFFADDGDDDDDEDDEDDDDGSDYEDMPPLVPGTNSNSGRNNNNNNNVRNSRNNNANASNQNSGGNGGDEEEDDGSSSDNSLPALVPRHRVNSSSDSDSSSSINNNRPNRNNNNNRGRGAAANRSNNNNNDSDSTDDDLPPLMAGNRGSDSDDSSDDSDAAMPELVPRRQVDSDSDEDDVPDLLPRGQAPSSDSSSESEGELPPLVPRRQVESGSESEDDDDEPPALAPRQAGGDSSSESSGMPALAPRRNRDDSSSDSDDSDDMPSLVPRRQVDSDSDGEMPGLMAPRRGDSSDSSNDDSDRAPSRRQGRQSNRPTSRRSAAATARSRSDSRSVSSSDENRPMSRQQQRQQRQRNARQQRQSATQASTSTARSRHAAAAPSAPAARRERTREELLEEERKKLKKWQPSRLRRKLRLDHGIERPVGTDKAELIELLANAIVDSSQQRANPTDPLSDMPSLIPVQSPPDNGFWILQPASSAGASQKMNLQYAFFQNSKIMCRSYSTFQTGSSLIPSPDGSTWVNTPSSNDQNARTVALVTQSSCVVDMYDKVNGPTLSMDNYSPRFGDCRNGVWAICSRDDTTRELNLVCANFRFPMGKVVADRVPLRSRLVARKEGGVWLFIPSGSNSDLSSLSAGLWLITTFQSNRILPAVNDAAVMSHDNIGRGVWMLEPSDENNEMTKLTHVNEDGTTDSNGISVKFDNVEGLCNAGDTGGVYVLHTRSNGWKVSYASLGVPNVTQIASCPRNSTIVSCGKGGAWIWSRTSSDHEAILGYIDRDERYHKCSKPFPPGSRVGVV